MEQGLEIHVTLPLNTLEVPHEGAIYYVSFSLVERELRNIDPDAAAAAKKAKQVKTEAKKAKKGSRRFFRENPR